MGGGGALGAPPARIGLIFELMAFRPFLLSFFKFGWNEQLCVLIVTPCYLNIFQYLFVLVLCVWCREGGGREAGCK